MFAGCCKKRRRCYTVGNMALSQLLWDVFLPSHSTWANIFHEIVKCLTFYIWYAFMCPLVNKVLDYEFCISLFLLWNWGSTCTLILWLLLFSLFFLDKSPTYIKGHAWTLSRCGYISNLQFTSEFTFVLLLKWTASVVILSSKMTWCTGRQECWKLPWQGCCMFLKFQLFTHLNCLCFLPAFQDKQISFFWSIKTCCVWISRYSHKISDIWTSGLHEVFN